MFTGLIKDIGTIKKITPNKEGKIFVIQTNALIQDIKIDDSVATNGVCLTATKIDANTFTAQAVHVTLEKTSLGLLKVGDSVNLELALRPMDRLGGHFVQGHVSGVGKLHSIKQLGENFEITITPPEKLFRYIIKEGSIALDGISLTIARMDQKTFTVSIIPHTYHQTNLHLKKIGDSINIEVDMMAKYLENFIKYDNNQSKDNKLKQLLEN